MDDRFLHEMRREPPAEFARALRQRLRAQEEERRGWAPRALPAMAAAVAVALLVAVFTVPSVRVSAQALLELFRVRSFAAVPFDESRLEKLRALEQNNALFVFDQKQIVLDPGKPQYYSTLEAAGAAVGLVPSQPRYLPDSLALDSIMVEPAGAARLAVSEAKLRALLDQLDLQSVSVPPGIDGAWVEVRKPAAVIQHYEKGRLKATLAQATSPEISVPAGLEIERLAEIGLRILGLDAGEAGRIARSTDWRSTLLVPVPMNASTFRQVTIHGQRGLLVTTTSTPSADWPQGRKGTVVLWAEKDRVFGLMSNLSAEDAMQMAESVQ
jgi:hypothetical protein